MTDNITYKRMEILSNPTKKVPVLFLIDNSASMNTIISGAGEQIGEPFELDGQMVIRCKSTGETVTLLDEVKKRVEDFNDAMATDKYACNTCQASFVTFSDKAKMVRDFRLVKKDDVPSDDISVGNDETNIADGIELALNMLDEQVELCQSVGCYTPWLIILTDGVPTKNQDRIESLKNELQVRQNNNKLIVYTMALSDDKNLYEQIRGYSIHKPISYDLGMEEIKKFFKFFKRSISTISTGKAHGKLESYTELDESVHLH